MTGRPDLTPPSGCASPATCAFPLLRVLPYGTTLVWVSSVARSLITNPPSFPSGRDVGSYTTIRIAPPPPPSFKRSRPHSSTASVELVALPAEPLGMVLSFPPATAPIPTVNVRPANRAAAACDAAPMPAAEAERGLYGAFPAYQPTVGSLGDDDSCRWPQMEVELTRPPTEAGEGQSYSVTQWLGSPSAEPPLLFVHELQYPWRCWDRSGVTVEEVIYRVCLCLSLSCMLKVYEASGVGETSSALSRLMAEGGGSGFQLPNELQGDCIFAYTIAEAEYVHRMGLFLSGPGQYNSRRFVLSDLAQL